MASEVSVNSQGLTVPLLLKTYTRDGAHHVLHDLARGDLEEVLQPLWAAQEAVERSVEVSFATGKALDGLTEAKGKRGSYWDLC